MKIGIIGTGLIGTSIALAARRAWPDADIIGVDRSDVVHAAEVPRAFHHLSTDPRQVLKSPIVILATPVDSIIECLRNHGPDLHKQTFVLDTGSTKRAILQAARSNGLNNFIGGHPMAGGESSGPRTARATLFDQRPWFLIDGSGSPALKEASQFVTALGARVVMMDDDGVAHDELMAAVSHLPQILATALMARVGRSVEPSQLQFAGAGLHDMTRLAASQAAMWESILGTNADLVRPLLTGLADDLREIAGQLEDAEAMRRLFDEANRWKRVTSSE